MLRGALGVRAAVAAAGRGRAAAVVAPVRRAGTALAVRAARPSGRSAGSSGRVLGTAAVLLAGACRPVFCDGADDAKEAAERLQKQAEAAAQGGQQAANELLLQLGTQINGLIETGVPAQLSWGMISGFCVGFAVKKASKVTATVAGVAFLGLQALSYNGYVNVEWKKISTDVEGWLDLNHDGKIDAEDLEIAKQKAMKVLTYNMPAGGGFVTGLVVGLRSG